MQYVSQRYPRNDFLAGCYKVVEVIGDEIEVDLDVAKWTKVTDGQWEVHPVNQVVSQQLLIHSDIITILT